MGSKHGLGVGNKQLSSFVRRDVVGGWAHDVDGRKTGCTEHPVTGDRQVATQKVTIQRLEDSKHRGVAGMWEYSAGVMST